ncbi:hypothetical protein SNE40_006329 [Patella caerulea]|uniref:CHHC U11-48K-type domain-containing protein n=1 Tax=Patella caerulea TaxID=87958 RepID=A0AAN8K054_PATCE
MSIYHVPDPEELIECPYDKVHMIRAKRYQYHLMKCRQNHAGQDYAICPFNAKHEMPKPELRYHMSNCPFRVAVEREIEYDENRRNGEKIDLKGCTDVPPYNAASTILDENWDAEIPIHARMGVDPSFFENLQYRNTSGMQRSERKEFYQKLRDKELGLETPSVTNAKTNQLRIPNQKSKAALMHQNTTKPHSFDVFAYSLSMAGIGRGKALLSDQATGASSRPGRQSTTTSPPTNNVKEVYSSGAATQ